MVGVTDSDAIRQGPVYIIIWLAFSSLFTPIALATWEHRFLIDTVKKLSKI